MIPRIRAILIVGLLGVGVVRAQGTTWLEARIAIEELAEAGEYSAAIKLEDELLALVADAFGDSSFESASTYLLMASIHSRNRDFATAESRILSALERNEVIDGPLSTRLIAPFVALGDNYHVSGEYALALGAYDEARTLSRRAYGLLDERQLAIVDRMSESALGLRQGDEAKALQMGALTLVQRAHGEDSLEFLEANYRYAAWLSAHRAFRSADLHFHSMYSLIRKRFDNDDWLRLRLLRVDAENFRRAGGVGTGHRHEPDELEEALEIAQEMEDRDPVLLAELYLDLGDWNVAFDRRGVVEDAFEQAWAELDGVENAAELRQRWFSELTIISAPPWMSPVFSNGPDDPWGRVEVEIAVDTNGWADDVTVIAAEPPGLADEAAIRQVRNSRFRPRMREGRVVESTATIGFDFQYRDR